MGTLARPTTGRFRAAARRAATLGRWRRPSTALPAERTTAPATMSLIFTMPATDTGSRMTPHGSTSSASASSTPSAIAPSRKMKHSVALGLR